MKVCLYSKCQKEFEPLKPKAKFCSAKCRVYYSRENKPLTTVKVINEVAKRMGTVAVAVETTVPIKQTLTIRDMPSGLTWMQKIAWKNENGII